MGWLSERRDRACRTLEVLAARYPIALTALTHESPFQLLVATLLSAQCPDARVNMVTPRLFSLFPTAKIMAQVPIQSLRKELREVNFYRNKARNIRALSRTLVDLYDGETPMKLDALIALPGIGRKTANVVMGSAYNIASGVVVDTHVGRICRRLGLTKQADPVKVEKDLMRILPKGEWIAFSHRLIFLGREICDARKPLCGECPLADFCPKIGVS